MNQPAWDFTIMTASTRGDRAVVPSAAAVVRDAWRCRPRAAIVLGTGLAGFVDALDVEARIAYRDLQGFPVPTAPAHRGTIVCGRLRDVPVLMFSGRCHLYEGYSVDEVTRWVRLAGALGAADLILSNASGGLNPAYRAGEVMLITGHIGLMGCAMGTRFGQADRSIPGRPRRPIYDSELLELASSLARPTGLFVHRGVYAGVTGPNYETRAEYRFLRAIGADAVGMSTVPEAVCAAQLGMRVLGLSVITNVARPDLPDKVDARKVVDKAAESEPRIQEMVTRLVATLE